MNTTRALNRCSYRCRYKFPVESQNAYKWIQNNLFIYSSFLECNIKIEKTNER